LEVLAAAVQTIVVVEALEPGDQEQKTPMIRLASFD
jgi:hypothetical protein